jgi:hypothetical protein
MRKSPYLTSTCTPRFIWRPVLDPAGWYVSTDATIVAWDRRYCFGSAFLSTPLAIRFTWSLGMAPSFWLRRVSIHLSNSTFGSDTSARAYLLVAMTNGAH